jgi:uncharacterized protein (DUF1778 family)
LTPVVDDADWREKGWAEEPEPLTASPRLESIISIRLDPETAALVRQAAALLGVTRAEFVRCAAEKEAAAVIRQDTTASDP